MLEAERRCAVIGMSDVEVLVIGGGAMGLSTAVHLACRGVDVRLVEQYSPGHLLGASHGACRNFNPAYAEPALVEMLKESKRLWHELEQQSGSTLLDLVGVVSHGPGEVYDQVFEALRHAGIAAEFVDPAEASRRWPGIAFDTQVLLTPDAGRIRAAHALDAMAGIAASHGAQLAFNTRALQVQPDESGVTVTLAPWQEPDGDGANAGADGEAREGGEVSETVRARVVVSAVNAWTQRLVGEHVMLPRLTVTQETPVHFPRFDAAIDWPSFNHRPDRSDRRYDYWLSSIYGMLTPGEGVKAGWHRVGAQVDPDARTFRSIDSQIEALQRYAREYLPGVDADSVDTISCTYTSSDDSHFVIDRVGNVVVLAGFAGEGFKFVPSVGRMAADLAAGVGGVPEVFSICRDRRVPGPTTVLGG